MVHLLLQVYHFATRRDMPRSHGRNVKRMKLGAQFWAKLCHLSVTWPGEINSPPWDNMLPLHDAAKPRNSQVCCENHTGKTAQSTEKHSMHLAGNSIITHKADSGTDIDKTVSWLVFLPLAIILFKCQIALAALPGLPNIIPQCFWREIEAASISTVMELSKVNEISCIDCEPRMSSLVSVTI